MKQVTVATLKLFGNHAALDFTNTVDSRGEHFGPDVLQSYGDLLDWGTRLSVLDAAEAEALRGLPAERGIAALTRTKVLREALYRIFATRPAADPLDLDLLQSEVRAAHEARMLLPEADGYAWRWRAEDPDTVTHRIALVAADLLTSSALDRVHICPGENCAWLFLDNSRAGRRRWCSEETCGTRSRVRRWRAHQRKNS
jgi:predicted RNA-binding Zn ribbon-like protein